MRRTAIVAFLAGVAFAPAAMAAPYPQLYDRAGDSTLPSNDIVSGRLSSFWSGKTPRLRGELRMLAAPATGVPSNYAFLFGVGCKSYSLTYDWAGGATDSAAALEFWDDCTPRETAVDEPDASFPANFTLKGTTLTWDAPYAGGLQRGQRVEGFAAGACPQVCGVAFDFDPNEPMLSGDLAWTKGLYVLGSDLPRR